MAVKGLDGDASRLGSFCAAAAYIIVGEDRADEYTTFGPLTSDYYNEKPLQWGFSYFQPTGAVIPTGTPYVREIARLLDILYSDLGCQLIAYGKEGIDWTWDDEGQTSWTFHVPDDWTGTPGRISRDDHAECGHCLGAVLEIRFRRQNER